MKILIVNDDGVNAIGIRCLAEWAKRLGEVTVVAPKHEQSGKSHAIDFMNDIEIKRVPYIEGVTAYSMDATPADCVRFGVAGLDDEFDLVLSGINRGWNIGPEIVYSGTVGAAFEAARLRTKAIAISSYPDEQTDAVKYMDDVWNYFVENGLFDENLIYNVNFPNDIAKNGHKGVRMTEQGSQYFTDSFVPIGNDLYSQRLCTTLADECPDDLDRDTVAVQNGYISVTPLVATRTNIAVVDKFRSKN
ncbi:MAG: 5'/3'-nucleotidase SurE [Ruminococcaceae bacterium]|nr:5'/3'-nucleotidase SurE [Oscillospiraceae bacterium]